MQFYVRVLSLPSKPARSLFLWGPRKVGKTSLLKSSYPDALFISLLDTKLFKKYLEAPWKLREELRANKERRLIIIDEFQLLPNLLNEIHLMIEEDALVFILCGSSARKVKYGYANLLGGRALRYELHGFSAIELGEDFDLERFLNLGYTPEHYLSSDRDLLISYIADYLKEEIAAEAVVRNLSAFSDFLHVASLSDAEILSYTNIARDCGISSPTVKEYFQILIDTLLGRYLPAYIKKPKRRVIQSPKFFFTDIGIVNILAKRGYLEIKSELFGKAFENWVFHELSTYNLYKKKNADLYYWRLSSGMEVDFIINDMEIAIEVKASANIHSNYLKGLREIVKDHPSLQKRYLVSLVDVASLTDDNILILPYKDFIQRLWAGEIF